MRKVKGHLGLWGGFHVWFSFHMKPRCEGSNQNHIHKTLMETVVRLKSWLTNKFWSSSFTESKRVIDARELLPNKHAAR